MHAYEENLELSFRDNCKTECAKEAVYLTLKTAIVKRIIPTNTVLNSSYLAKLFYLSRTPVESALARLAHEGLILNTPQNGYLTYSYSFKELRDSNEFMLGLYFMTNTLAQNKIDYYYTNLLNQKLNELDAIEDCHTYLHERNLFHLLIAESTGNKNLIHSFKHEIDKSALINLKNNLNEHATEFMLEHKKLDHQLLEIISCGTNEDLLKISVEHNEHMRHFIFKHSLPV